MRALAIAAMLIVATMVWGGEEPPPPVSGVAMPRFALFDLQQEPLRLSEVTERVVVINFFAFWCDTWIDELPQLRQLVAREDELNFRLISVCVDGAWTDQLAEVCGEDGVPWPVLIDRERSLSEPLRLRKVPTVMVLGRQRIIRHVYEGYPGNLVLLGAIREAGSAD